MNSSPALYIGLMSGTSMDAIDTALVSFADDHIELIAYEEFAIDSGLRNEVRQLNLESNIKDLTHYDALMGHLFADSVLKILDISSTPASDISAIGNHGQTILHLPDASFPRTLQIGDPNIIAYKTGITTIGDFRRMDMAAGGQGAPLAPAFHAGAFRQEGVNRVVLNLGGIANISVLSGATEKPFFGFDTGPGNGLMDDWNQLHQNTAMDKDGLWAKSGQIQETLLKRFMSDTYFQLSPPKSSGRDYFNLQWLRSQIDAVGGNFKPADVQATLLQLSVLTIAEAIRQHAPHTQEVYMCGGGSHNKALTQALGNQLSGIKLMDTGSVGLNPDAVEAVTFAWLAKQTISGQPGNQPMVTGAHAKQILGGIYQPLKNQGISEQISAR